MNKTKGNKMNSIKHLKTVYSENIGDIPHPEYPRPALKRASFINLNGKWDFGVTNDKKSPVFDREIIVPFPPESILSGINSVFDEELTLCYQRKFTIPDGFIKDRVILHFGAVDQYAEVYLNGAPIGEHVGGYQGFSFDITEAVKDENTLTVFVRDELSSFVLPYGKQKRNRGGMWYTPVSGIWQTVWLESVSLNHITSLDLPTSPEYTVLKANFSKEAQYGTVEIESPDGKHVFPLINGEANLNIPNPRLWSPEDPYLYRAEIITESDRISTYFALRTIEIKTVCGVRRLCLNGKPYFFHGLLDQGYYPDGIFTPATIDAYRDDITKMKSLGFNMLRKHIKIEPQIFYYLCDSIGMVVFQDMVNNSDYSFIRDTVLPTAGVIKKNDKKAHGNPASRKAFLSHMEETVSALKNHPCIYLWTIFNEGWGQFCGSDAYKKLKKLDPTRIVDTASGWFGGCESDVDSRHIYFRKVKLKPGDKPLYLSEFGGYSHRVDGHVANENGSYGYGSCKSRQDFVNSIIKLYNEQIIPLKDKGLSATVYTQVSDVEDEINGILTYDRAVMKITPNEFSNISEKLKL